MVGAVIVAVLGGTFFYACLNRPVDLSKVTIYDVRLSLRNPADSICARDGTALRVQATVQRWGRRQVLESWESSGYQFGRLDYADFTFFSNQGSVRSDGTFLPSENMLETAGSPFVIVAAPKAAPERLSSLERPPSYDCVDAVGGRGQTGASGGVGSAGPIITAYVTLVETPFYPQLIAVSIKGEINTVALAPADQQLTLYADGGSGGRGSRGHDGQDGDCGIFPTDATDGGDGGPGGHGGAGGHITVIVDENFPELREQLLARAQGGAGGEGGAGGRGGSVGTSFDEDDECGSSGSSGRRGQPGMPGPSGTTSIRLGDVSGAFAALDTAEGINRMATEQPKDTGP